MAKNEQSLTHNYAEKTKKFIPKWFVRPSSYNFANIIRYSYNYIKLINKVGT